MIIFPQKENVRNFSALFLGFGPASLRATAATETFYAGSPALSSDPDDSATTPTTNFAGTTKHVLTIC